MPAWQGLPGDAVRRVGRQTGQGMPHDQSGGAGERPSHPAPLKQRQAGRRPKVERFRAGSTGGTSRHRREAVPVSPWTKPTPGLSCYAGNMTAVHASPPEPGTKPTYPIAQWFDGQRWTLTRGRDYWGTPNDFLRSLQASANARSISVRVELEDLRGTVTIQAVPRG